MELFNTLTNLASVFALTCIAVVVLKKHWPQRPQPKKVEMRVLSADERRKTCFHEAGHATLTLVLLPDIIEQVFVLNEIPLEPPDDDTDVIIGGAVVPKQLTMGQQTRTIARHSIVALYGGYYGELLADGEPTGGTHGDLKKAVLNAGDYIDHFGLPDKDPIFYEAFVQGLKLRHPDRERALWEAAEAILTESSKEARETLQREQALFHAIARALNQKGVLHRDELLALRKQYMVKASS